MFLPEKSGGIDVELTLSRLSYTIHSPYQTLHEKGDGGIRWPELPKKDLNENSEKGALLLDGKGETLMCRSVVMKR
jgi:hypothetical protein